MATLRDVKAQKPVGSLAWIEAEKENVSHLMVQEMEEIEYPVRYEMDWLNEHMAEVFGGNQLYELACHSTLNSSSYGRLMLALVTLLKFSKPRQKCVGRHLGQ